MLVVTRREGPGTRTVIWSRFLNLTEGLRWQSTIGRLAYLAAQSSYNFKHGLFLAFPDGVIWSFLEDFMSIHN